MSTVLTIIIALIVFGAIVFFHELGHFLAAKLFGVYCGQFSIGFGPKIWSKKGKETEYELRALPFGGFVAMAGEEDQEDNESMKNVPYERTLKGIKAYQKIIIFGAGVFMNFILAIVVLFSVNLVSGKVPVVVAQIGEIAQNSPAQEYGLEVNDVITQVDVQTGETYLISNYGDLDLSRNHLNTESDTIHVTVTVQRNDSKQSIPMTLSYDAQRGIYPLGIVQATRAMSFPEVIQYTFMSFGEMSVAIFQALGQLITQFSKTITQLSGPAGIYQITAEVTESGQVGYIFNLLAMLSVNVGIFNLLPIPGLDGCQILFVVVERIIGRELPSKMKLILQMMGLALVMLLMIFVTFQDISRIFG